MEHQRWLYPPCVVLILASYAIQFAARRRSSSEDKPTGASDTIPPHEERLPCSRIRLMNGNAAGQQAQHGRSGIDLARGGDTEFTTSY